MPQPWARLSRLRTVQILSREDVCSGWACPAATRAIFGFYFYYPRTPAGIVALHGE